jgi:hypothetical protein
MRPYRTPGSELGERLCPAERAADDIVPCGLALSGLRFWERNGSDHLRALVILSFSRQPEL